VTHGYQHVPQHCGGYRSGTDHYGFIEGSADAIRILAGYHKTRKPRPGGHWNSGYTTTEFFIVWLAKNRDLEFLYKLNQTCKTIDPWSWDAACKTILGKGAGVEQLWNEYQWDLKGGGKEAVANFQPDKEMICHGESIQFSNTSFNAPTTYAWTFEGGTPNTSTAKAPVVTYDKPGKFAVSLVAKNAHGETSKSHARKIQVLDRKGTVTNLIGLRGEITLESKTPAIRGEGVGNLIDKNPQSKFCVKERKTRIQYAAPDSYELFSYAITSANDYPGRDPENWTLEGSTDGRKWSEIDRQKDQAFEARHETRRFVVDCKTAYRFYRWNLEAKSEQIFQFAELQMLGISGK